MPIIRIREKKPVKVLQLSYLGAGESSYLSQCKEIDARDSLNIGIAVRVTFPDYPNRGDLRVSVRSSPDGVYYDTESYATFDIPFKQDSTVQMTRPINPSISYLKIIVKNLDTAYQYYGIIGWVIY